MKSLSGIDLTRSRVSPTRRPQRVRPKSRPGTTKPQRLSPSALTVSGAPASRANAIFVALVLVLGLLALAPQSPSPSGPLASDSAPSSPSAVMASLPLYFEANHGQVDPAVMAYAKKGGVSIFLTGSEVVYSLSRPKDSGESEPKLDPFGDDRDRKAQEYESAVIRMGFVGANSDPEVVGEGKLEGKTNYFLGNDPSKWVTEVPTYSQMRYVNLYDGIDLVFYENAAGELEHDFVVAPGADPSKIKLAIRGTEDLSIADDGSFRLTTSLGEISQSAPRTYQDISGDRREIESRYAINEATGEVGYELGDYDTTHPIVIDPSLVYSSYLGGSNNDFGYGIAVDYTGGTYVTGRADSSNFPVAGTPYQGSSGGSIDVFVSKLNSAGSTLMYSTYIGGTTGDYAVAIAVDLFGAAYVTGNTNSATFPAAGSPFQGTSGGVLDAFVTKVNPSGSTLDYSSFLGGSANEYGEAIAVDSLGAAFITGSTASANFPTAGTALQGATGGGTDAFVSKVNPTGTALNYSTFLGGSGGDYGRGVAVDSSGAAYVGGSTTSANFPTAGSPFQGSGAGGDDAFVAKVNSTGSALAYSSYLGGSANDNAYGLAIDSAGAAYLAGYTASTNFPTAGTPFQGAAASSFNAFVSKVNAAGSALTYSTYLGGSGGEYCNEIAVDSTGSAYVVGNTTSSDFPSLNPFQAATGGSSEAFVTKLQPTGSALVYSSFLGGSGSDFGYSVALNTQGSAFMAGNTTSGTFPMREPFQGSLAGMSDAFVARIGPSNVRASTKSSNGQSVGPANRPDIADSGRFVAFHSPAGDLFGGDANGTGDVFVKTALTGTIERASVSTGGTEGNGSSIVASISPDGRYVAYFSQATNLVAGDTNGVGDVFLRDRQTSTTERISVSSSETESDGASRYPQVTPDGRYVVFQSEASNLVAGDANGKWDIFLRDRTLGTTERISVTSGGGQSDKASARPSVSDDGNLIAFHSWATNLVVGDSNAVSDVFLRDRGASTTTRVSLTNGGAQASGESAFPKVSGDGTVVVFHSLASNLIPSDSNASRDVFARILGSSTTERVSTTAFGTEGDSTSGYADISSDARYVVFHSVATNMVLGDTNAFQDVFVRDRTGATTRRVSIASDGTQANEISGMSAISADGGFVAYQAKASNLVPDDTNGAQDAIYTQRP